ncbi:SDR family oxidoreductase [Lascolabacillus sp.]|jgi:NAD(P)-dependent dehydrogenase (short-subunit alcohol dehydrogenase family)|uniref:SDR family NAD(P)-dependent oxidoreductase n=1 Tax=Bacteria TaxID=2 RepID=UPI002583BA97|nr:SDR family oxidoreductase [Lascolabacillus sp.]MDD2608018.1 SDR family NAD(P)-dependent oxidoreductase [Lascolabacillus sp.]
MNNYSKNPFSLEGKKILVTGASSGIGEAISIWISRMGGQVALLARSKEKLEKTLSKLEENNHKVLSLDLLSQEEEIEEAINNLGSEWGPLNGMVHSAGIFSMSPLRNFSYKECEEIFKLNHNVFLLLSKLLVKKGKMSPKSSIVAISSVAGLKGNVALSLYGASKAALISSIRCLALEYASKGIRFNCICPGWVNTPMLEDTQKMLGEELFKQNIIAPHPLGLGTPDDVAYAAIYLLSEASRWVTGSSLIVDGGYSC